ncbi:Rieske domain-containing protein [Tenacibaculum sp. 190130A14a]|uniref:Rieske domain-containing protein n=1 Tax=Tenacibaculum polynesiense TaxID=3137857 RepID=A0ABP1F5E8_9FLAO
MRKILSLFVFIVFYGCGSEIVQNTCFNGVRLNEVINLSNPEFIDLQVPNGSAITRIGGRTVLVIRRNSHYQAFDLECPEKNCGSPMTYDGLKLKCPCDNKEYNSLNGSPLNNEGCFALEYNVLQINSSSLQISR